MKVIRDCISQELHDALNTEIRSLAGHQVWLSSAVDWCDSIKQGIQGSTLTTPMPDALCEMLEEEIKEHLPPYDKLNCSFYIWQANSGIAMHNDNNYKFGGTIYLNDEWYPQWGGLYVWIDKGAPEDAVGHALLPKARTCVLNNQSEYHMVTPVSPYAQAPRFTVQFRAHK